MLKQAYFLAALNNGAYRYADWVFSVFTVLRNRDYKTVDIAKKHFHPEDIYNFMLYRDEEQGKYCFLNNDDWEIIEDSDISQPLFAVDEGIEILDQGDLVQPVKKDVTFPFIARVGNLFVNYYCLVSAFGNRIPYQSGKVSISQLENIVIGLLDDYPEDPTQIKPDRVYPDMVKNFSSACSSMAGFAGIAAPSATPYTMVAAPGIHEYRNKLLEENKDRLTDPVVIAMIEKKLVEYDRNWQAQDPDGGFLQKKAFEVSRKKLFGIHGLEMSDISSGKPVLIKNSLSEGWDVKNLPAMNDSLRSGSYNRGALTALGGEAVKFIFRIFATTSITEKDCGSSVGIPRRITENNAKLYFGNTIIVPSGQILLTPQNIKQYINKDVIMRTPACCKTSNANYCLTCCGMALEGSENAVAALTSKVGSKMLDIFMAKMHGTALVTTPWRIRETIF